MGARVLLGTEENPLQLQTHAGWVCGYTETELGIPELHLPQRNIPNSPNPLDLDVLASAARDRTLLPGLANRAEAAAAGRRLGSTSAVHPSGMTRWPPELMAYAKQGKHM